MKRSGLFIPYVWHAMFFFHFMGIFFFSYLYVCISAFFFFFSSTFLPRTSIITLHIFFLVFVLGYSVLARCIPLSLELYNELVVLILEESLVLHLSRNSFGVPQTRAEVRRMLTNYLAFFRSYYSVRRLRSFLFGKLLYYSMKNTEGQSTQRGKVTLPKFR